MKANSCIRLTQAKQIEGIREKCTEREMYSRGEDPLSIKWEHEKKKMQRREEKE